MSYLLRRISWHVGRVLWYIGWGLQVGFQSVAIYVFGFDG